MCPKLLLLAILVGTLGTHISCETPESALRIETEEFHESFPAKPNVELSVENRNGDVIIRTWDNDSIDVFARKKTRAPRRELKKVKIKIDRNDEIVIRSEYTEKTARVSVDYEIKIPPDVAVGKIHTLNGDLKLTGIKGEAIATSANGKIAIKDVRGYVTVTTQNGAIDISGTTGIAKATTSNGNIRAEILNIRNSGVDFALSNGNILLYVAEGLEADVEMGTTNGKMSVHNIKIATTESTPKRIKGKIGKGGPRIYARTSNGNVDLYKLETED
jgi:hypothetical protein